MSKGKYKARKENRDTARRTDSLAQVRTELAREQARLDQARERAAMDCQLRQELAAAIAARDSACAPQLERINSDRILIQTATRDLKAATRKLSAHNDRIVRWGLKEFGPERYYALISGDRVFLREGVAHDGLDQEAVEAIQRARGRRDVSPPNFTTEQRRILGVEVAAVTGIALPDSVTGEEDDGWDEYTALVEADMAAQIAFKHPVPWVDNKPMPERLASRVLGADPSGLPFRVDPVAQIPQISELSTGTAALREATAAAGASAVAVALTAGLEHRAAQAARSHYSSPIASVSGYPAPSDAAALHAWYSAAAIGAWGRHRTSVNGRAAVAAVSAVPFWLPPGHTIAYLDSEPLSAEDVEDIRLPFAQTLVVFAEPARLPALDASDEEDPDPRLAWMDHVAGADKFTGGRDLIIAGTNQFTMPRPTLWDVIGCRGAYIEGVLLLADAHGKLEDLFAWCIALPSGTPGAVLGRWVIPASRAATSYANLVINAAAVAAWADWHRPGHDRTDEGPETQQQSANGNGKSHRSAERDNVHVLNVTVTTPPPDTASAARGEPTGRTTAPHRRRGHWRRQHYGPGRANTRRVRIAPVLVNAGRVGSDRPQIYRLPAPPQ